MKFKIRTKLNLKKINTNLLLTEREGRTGEYWPEVVTVRTERSEVRAKTAEGQYYVCLLYTSPSPRDA